MKLLEINTKKNLFMNHRRNAIAMPSNGYEEKRLRDYHIRNHAFGVNLLLL